MPPLFFIHIEQILHFDMRSGCQIQLRWTDIILNGNIIVQVKSPEIDM